MGWPEPGLWQGKDLSLSGILFQSENPMELGTKIQLEVPLSSRDKLLVMVGRVTRSQPSGSSYNVGATFLHFGDQDRVDITRHFSNLLQTTSSIH